MITTCGYQWLMSSSEPATGDILGAPASDDSQAAHLARDFTLDSLAEVRHALQTAAGHAGLTGQALDDFVVAVHELATNAIRHGGGRGRVDLRCVDDTLLCDVLDYGPGFGADVPAAGVPPPAETPGGRGLWLARQLTDTLMVSDRPDGVTVSVTVCLPASASGPATADHAAVTFPDFESDGPPSGTGSVSPEPSEM
jgi:anti-sigma regulatory factor (Ser/Thr protein kinase)